MVWVIIDLLIAVFLAAEREHETETTSEFDVHLSDMRSEFSEYSGSRKSSVYAG